MTEVLRSCSFACPVLSVPKLWFALNLSLACAQGSDIQLSYHIVTGSCMSGSSPQLPCSLSCSASAAIPGFLWLGKLLWLTLYLPRGQRKQKGNYYRITDTCYLLILFLFVKLLCVLGSCSWLRVWTWYQAGKRFHGSPPYLQTIRNCLHWMCVIDVPGAVQARARYHRQKRINTGILTMCYFAGAVFPYDYKWWVLCGSEGKEDQPCTNRLCLALHSHTLSLLLAHLFALMPLHSVLKANHISYIFKRTVAYNWYRS